MTPRIILAMFTTGFALALASGCRDDDSGPHGHSSVPQSGGAPATTRAAAGGDHMMMAHSDKDLVAMLIEHHDGAIRLSDLELQKGDDADTKAIAQKNKDQQTKERQDLQRLQQQLGGPGMGMSADMKAKQAKAEKELSSASGHDADHVFLKHMTEHHKDGIQMVQNSLPNLKNDELKQMGQKMVQDQQRDVEKMQKMMH